MTQPEISYADDAALAADIAEEAGRLLLEVRAEFEGVGSEGKATGQAGDRRSNELILGRLADARPADAVLSEESADSPARLTAQRVWIVDPLDGTREFSMPGRTDWAVHVALWESGRGLVAGAVAQPALGAVYRSHPPPVASEAARAVPTGRPPRIVVSDSRAPAFAGAVAAAVDAELVTMGSAGAKAMAVVRGEVDAYLHAGGQWEWDSAAPVVVARAAGLHASGLDGTELPYNQPRPYLPELLICVPRLAPALISALAGHCAG